MSSEDKSFEAGMKFLNIYTIIKFIIFVFNIFVVCYSYFNKPILLIPCIIINIIYMLFYVRRIYLNITGVVLAYFLFKDWLTIITLGIAFGNIISYIFDSIYIFFTDVLLKFIDYMNKKVG